MTSEIIHALSEVYLKTLPDNSVDAIVTDPPYEYGFMGKEWDKSGISYDINLWKECFRVLKPGGHLLAFGGTRTYHRLAYAIEDAGFQIRDQIQWIYGSGFPKSLDISKAIDKKEGKKRPMIKKMVGDINNARYAGKEKSPRVERMVAINEPQSDLAEQWDGWGTGLKPANEPICLARKPLSEKSVAENVLKHGTGGINIEGCRIDSEKGNGVWGSSNKTCKPSFCDSETVHIYKSEQHPAGRFPSNVILDEEAGSMLDGQAPKTGAMAPVNTRQSRKTKNCYGDYSGSTDNGRSFHDGILAGASRFFYCAKASRKERDFGLEGFEIQKTDTDYSPNDDGSKDIQSCLHGATIKGRNNHPTVKPVTLMRYLCRLITPPGGTILDPFVGSGPTGIAAKLEGFSFIGIDKGEENCNIARARIAAYMPEEETKKIFQQDLDFKDDITD